MTALNLARQLLESTRRHVEKSDDPYVISRFGDLQIRVDVAAALFERAETHPSRWRSPRPGSPPTRPCLLPVQPSSN